MQLYIRNLFYHVLMRNSSDQVLKLARKLHWEDPAARPPFSLAHSTLTLVHPQIVRKLHSAFTKVWKIKYSNVHLFAVLLYDLGRYHPEFKIGIIDEVLENIRVGMEVRPRPTPKSTRTLTTGGMQVNSFKYNQQRIATVKYLGELYNYRVVEPPVILDTLWSLVTFGHRTFLGSSPQTSTDDQITAEGRPWPEVPSPIDAPDDCFRVRLVCTLLDTCGSCFVRGALKKKLDNFITFFQVRLSLPRPSLNANEDGVDVHVVERDHADGRRFHALGHVRGIEAQVRVVQDFLGGGGCGG
jgi:regulator of nonsense transcripts 2